MPETMDDLFAPVFDDVAARTRAPGAQAVIAAGRRRTKVMTAASVTAVLVCVVLGGALLSGGRVEPSPAAPPATPTGVPVWYDRDGLHHGDDVYQTSVPLGWGRGGDEVIPLSLVQGGALYSDPARDEVWFQPWGGTPTVVGKNAMYGAVGDPESNIAAWFESSELVVYDTAEAQEIARVATSRARCCGGGEHVPVSSGFLQLSPESVVWISTNDVVLRLDLQTLDVTAVMPSHAPRGSSLTDIDDETELWSSPGLGIRTPSHEQFYSEFEPTKGRLSPDGRFLLGVTRHPHGTAFVDVEDAGGEPNPLPEDPFPDKEEGFYAFIAWSYGNTAVLLTRDSNFRHEAVLACNPVLGTCERLPNAGNVILPSS